jgi:hypothetical protein
MTLLRRLQRHHCWYFSWVIAGLLIFTSGLLWLFGLITTTITGLIIIITFLMIFITSQYCRVENYLIEVEGSQI